MIWNKDYALEAAAIVAEILDEDKQHWLADEIRRGRTPVRRDLRIAMRALMVARGEHDLPTPLV